MSRGDRSADRKSVSLLSAPSENTLLVVIAICFLILHVATFMLLTPTRYDGAATPIPLSRGD